MISYAQNGEDVVLARLFDGDTGFYVDLGAGHPIADSVTKHFSERGWRGLNIEPLPEEHALLCADRPRDRNLAVAVTDHPGTVTLHVAPPDRRGRSTTLDELVPAMADGRPVTSIEVPSVRLDDLLDAEGVEHIDFLKIDVEGAEEAIISGTDWTAVHPRVLVVEATLPGVPLPAFDAWEPVLLAAGYRCALFDGLNRFYADAGDDRALAALSVPANVHDGAQPYYWVERVRALEEQLSREVTSRVGIAHLGQSLEQVAEEARRLALEADPGSQFLAGRT